MADPRITQDPVEVPTGTPGETVVTQDPVEVVVGGDNAAVTQLPVEVVASQDTETRSTQNPVEVIQQSASPPAWVTQYVVEVIGKGLGQAEDDFINVFIVM